jgi:lysine 6-dehydrogenase
MKKIVVLGAGMVGSAMAIDLSYNYDVTSVDINTQSLKLLEKDYNIKTINLNVNDSGKLSDLLANYDLVLNAVPGFMGFNTLKTIILAGKNVVDISFFPEDCFELELLAVEKGVTAIVDFGVAPGMNYFLLGYHYKRMKVNDFKCYVGGLPSARKLPFQYKAPFSPIDVIEEYTREARYMRNGKIVTMPALSEPEYLEFDSIGTLEAFNTDGLRSLLKTMKIDNMLEKTLRYPGHIEKIQFLKDAGFFDTETIELKNGAISPIELTAKLLFKHWKLEDGEDEFTVMRIIIEGEADGAKKVITYDLHDKYDAKTNTSSMSRTTGYAGTAAMNLLAKNLYSNPGINPPEYIGMDDECYAYVLNYQKDRGIYYNLSVK